MVRDRTGNVAKCIGTLSQNNDFLGMAGYLQHGRTDCLLHCIAVAYYSQKIAAVCNIRLDENSLIRGALLHDFFLYDWHEQDASHKFHGFTHPKIALKNALCSWDLNDTEKDIILKHMFPLIPAMPQYKESMLVCIIDKICSVREALYIPYCSKVEKLYIGINLKKSEQGVEVENDD